MRLFKGSLAAIAAVSMATSPVLAQSASALSVRSSAQVEDANELQGGFIIPLVAVVAVILGILVIVDDGDGPPRSP